MEQLGFQFGFKNDGRGLACGIWKFWNSLSLGPLGLRRSKIKLNKEKETKPTIRRTTKKTEERDRMQTLRLHHGTPIIYRVRSAKKSVQSSKLLYIQDEGYLPEALGVYEENRLLTWSSYQSEARSEIIAQHLEGGSRNPIDLDLVPIIELGETSSVINSAFASVLPPVNWAIESKNSNPANQLWEFNNATHEKEDESTGRNYPPPHND